MFERVKGGWDVASATRKLIFKDKQLLLYPIISMIVGLIEAVAIFAPLVLAKLVGAGGVVFVLLVLYYVLVGFTSTYIMMAMMIAFRSYVSGQRIGVWAAMGRTAQYSVLILEWSVFYTVIIMVLRMVEQRLGFIGRIIIGSIASIALAAATIFVVPVILDDRVGPVEAVKRSAGMLVHHFGATFGGLAYSDLYSLMFVLAGFGVMVLGGGILYIHIHAVSAGVGGVIAVAVLFAIGIAMVVVGALLSYTIGGAYRLILYDYVKSGRLPQGFTKEMIDSSITKKKGAL